MRTPRDPSNISPEPRRLLDGFDCAECAGTGLVIDTDGSPARTFRKTVATKLDIAGFSPRAAAGHLGHASPSMTLHPEDARAAPRLPC